MRLNTGFRNSFFVLALSAFLAACGGGGGGGTAAAASTGQHAGPKGDGTALVTWEAPTAKIDGSCLSDLQSYRINYGLASSVYDSHQTVDAGSLSCVDTGKTDSCGQVKSCSYMVDNLGEASTVWWLS